MHPFEQTISIIGPIVGAIIFLALFFRLFGWASRNAAFKSTRGAARGVFEGRTLATVHLSNGSSLEDVRIHGFTDTSCGKAGLPFELGQMVILEHADGRHTLVHAKLIRKIDVPPQQQ